MTSARRHLLVCLPLLFGGDALAHPSARSTFDARTADAELQVVFRLDEAALGHVLGDGAGDDDTVLAYLGGGFQVGSDRGPCPLSPRASLRADPAQGKRIVGATFACPGVPRTLELRSNLFIRETAPHPIVGVLRHRRAVERYFFNRVERVARADLDALRQVAGHSADQRQFRTATPPAGAYVTASRRAAGPTAPPPAPADRGVDLTPIALALLAIPLALRGGRWLVRRRANETAPLPLEESP